MEFGTFLLLQTPSAQPSDVIYARGVEITQAAEELGFNNMWLAEHHFSTYGLLSRPLTYALHLANKTRRIRVGANCAWLKAGQGERLWGAQTLGARCCRESWRVHRRASGRGSDCVRNLWPRIGPGLPARR